MILSEIPNIKHTDADNFFLLAGPCAIESEEMALRIAEKVIKITDKLIEPGVVGWFSGRAEFGPRALGGRSIIADPRNNKAKELLNAKIKRWYRHVCADESFRIHRGQW